MDAVVCTEPVRPERHSFHKHEGWSDAQSFVGVRRIAATVYGRPAEVANDAAERLLASRGRLPARHAFLRSELPAHALFALDLNT